MGPAQTDARYTLWRYAIARRLLVALRHFFLGRVLLGVHAGVSDLLEADVPQSDQRLATIVRAERVCRTD
jgi:hypothetical protein